jgi:hypothetical protein
MIAQSSTHDRRAHLVSAAARTLPLTSETPGEYRILAFAVVDGFSPMR